MEDDFNIFKMEDDLNIFKMEDDLICTTPAEILFLPFQAILSHFRFVFFFKNNKSPQSYFLKS
jgi:hypothetical protein